MSAKTKKTEKNRQPGGDKTERSKMRSTRTNLPTASTLIRPVVLRWADRLIHFIDIENIAGGPHLTLEKVRQARALYMSSGLYQLGDLVYIACSRNNGAVVGLGWPEGHLALRTGQDGADFELIEAIKRERVPERFAQMVIASGDGIFTTRAEILRREGVEVTVVAPTGGLSNRLRRAASNTVLIDTEAVRMFFYPSRRESA